MVTEPWQGKGGKVTYTFTGACDYAYPFAGVGFNWFKAEGDTKYLIKDESDPASGATGIKIKYSLKKTGTIKRCVVELGTSPALTANDSYAAKLDYAPGEGGILDHTSDGKVFDFGADGDFTQEGWGLDQGGTDIDWEEAWRNSEGFKFKCEAGAANRVATVELVLKEISFVGGGEAPILKLGSSFAGVSMAQNGRMVSLSVGKAAPVQVISLQGALVHAQTVTPESGNMNLGKLPAGVYMVRVPSLGYTNKVMLK